jgi:hypothetical protein
MASTLPAVGLKLSAGIKREKIGPTISLVRRGARNGMSFGKLITNIVVVVLLLLIF